MHTNSIEQLSIWHIHERLDENFKRVEAILGEDHLETVRKHVLLELNLRNVGRALRGAILRRGRHDGGNQCDGRRGEETGVHSSCLHGQSFVGSLFRLAHKYQHATDR